MSLGRQGARLGSTRPPGRGEPRTRFVHRVRLVAGVPLASALEDRPVRGSSADQIWIDPSGLMVHPGLCATSHT